MDLLFPVFTIVLQVCTGVTCETKHLPMMEFTNKIACDLRAQGQAAVWVQKHPGWQIKRVTCYPQGKEPKPSTRV